jgi:hypothetical protein
MLFGVKYLDRLYFGTDESAVFHSGLISGSSYAILYEEVMQTLTL